MENIDIKNTPECKFYRALAFYTVLPLIFFIVIDILLFVLNYIQPNSLNKTVFFVFLAVTSGLMIFSISFIAAFYAFSRMAVTDIQKAVLTEFKEKKGRHHHFLKYQSSIVIDGKQTKITTRRLFSKKTGFVNEDRNYLNKQVLVGVSKNKKRIVVLSNIVYAAEKKKK